MTATVGLRAAAWEAGLLVASQIPQIFRILCPCFLANRESTNHWKLMLMFSSKDQSWWKATACLGRSSFLGSESLWILSLPSAPEVLHISHITTWSMPLPWGASSFSSSNCRAKASPPSSWKRLCQTRITLAQRHHYQSSLKLFDFNLFHIFLLHLQWVVPMIGAMVDKADALQYPSHNCASTKGGGMMLIHATDWYLRNLLFCAPVAGKSQAGSHEHWKTLHVCKYSCLMPNNQTNTM